MTLKNRLAVMRLFAGEVIAYPTEAVWGLGCDPLNNEAVQRLLALKGRRESKGLILITGSLEHIDFLLDPLSAAQRATCVSTWPGPVTWLLPDPERLIPSWIKGAHGSVAVRVSDHPGVHALCKDFGGPLISTSANIAGRPAIKQPGKIRKQFKNKVYLHPGQLGGLKKPTQIMDALTGKVIRYGDQKR